MQNDFVTVATCQFEAQAESMKLMLAEEGVDAYVLDANTMTANWLWGPALGFIKVQVAKQDAAAALEAIRRHPRMTPEAGEAADEAPAKCLACGAIMPEDAEVCPNCGWTFEAVDGDDDRVEPAGE